MKLYHLSVALFSVLLIRCAPVDKTDANQYILPLEKLPFTLSKPDSSMDIRLIAFSGGRESTPEETYYDQFIGVTGQGDTVRILTPLISTGAEHTWTSPLLFNIDKGIERARYEPADSAMNVGIHLLTGSEEVEKDSINRADHFDKMKQKSRAKEWVVMVRNVSLFETVRFKTYAGTLHFDQRPW